MPRKVVGKTVTVEVETVQALGLQYPYGTLKGPL